jgi:hypothetical protein
MSKAVTARSADPKSVNPGDPIGRMDKAAMLDPKRLADPAFGWRTFEATLPQGVASEHAAADGFWRLCGKRLRRGDHIRYRDDALTRFGEVVVVAADAGTGAIEVRGLWSREIAPATARESEKLGFTPADFGVHEKWGIVRDADGHVMCKGIDSFDEAMRRIRVEYLPIKATRIA